MNNFLQWLGTVIRALFRIAVRGAVRYGLIPLGAFTLAMFTIIVLADSLMLLAWALKLKWLAVLVGILSGLIFIFTWKSSLFLVRLVANIANLLFLNKANRIVGSMYNAFQDLVSPLRFTAMCLSFLGAVAAIKGVNFLSMSSLIMWTAVATFFWVVSFYFRGKTLWPQYIMIAIIISLLVMNVLFPIQARAIVNFSERISIHGSSKLNLADRDGDLIIVPKGTPLYDKDMKKISSTEFDVKAKIVDALEDGETGEQVYEVILPTIDSVYLGGMIYYVPTRSTKEIEVEEIRDEETKNYTPPLLNERIVGQVKDKQTAYFYADKPFVIKEKTEDGFVGIQMPSGKSSRYFAWGGNVRILDSTRTDVKICSVK